MLLHRNVAPMYIHTFHDLAAMPYPFCCVLPDTHSCHSCSAPLPCHKRLLFLPHCSVPPARVLLPFQ